MNRHWKTLLLALVVIIAGVLLSPPRERIEKNGIERDRLEQAGKLPAHPTSTPTREAPADPDISLLAPSATILREEVGKNPHRPPPSLLRFSEQVNDRTDAALSDEAESQQLLRQFSDCASRSDLSPSVQVICLSQAERLSQAHASLRPAFEQMRDQAAPETRRIFEMLQKKEPR